MLSLDIHSDKYDEFHVDLSDCLDAVDYPYHNFSIFVVQKVKNNIYSNIKCRANIEFHFLDSYFRLYINYSINTVSKSIDELLTDFVSEIVTENKSDSCAALNIQFPYIREKQTNKTELLLW